MLKKLLFLLVSINACMLGSSDEQGMSTRTKVILGTVVIATGLVAAPFVLPAATVAGIQAAAVTVGVKIAAVSATASAAVGTTVTAAAGPMIGNAAATVTAGLISVPTVITVGIVGAKVARPYVFETEEEELHQFHKAEAADLLTAKRKLQTCLMKTKNDSVKGNFGCSVQCQDSAYQFALIAGKDELDRIIKSIR